MAEETKETKVPVEEDRIDEMGLDSFRHLGYTGRLPDPLVATYKSFKGRKDKLLPGSLTPEGIVTVIFLAGLIGNKEP